MASLPDRGFDSPGSDKGAGEIIFGDLKHLTNQGVACILQKTAHQMKPVMIVRLSRLIN